MASTSQFLNAFIQEASAVAQALGMELHHDPKDAVRVHAPRLGTKPACCGGVLAIRSTEIGFISGAMVGWGEEAGVPIPLNRTLWALIKGLEHSWTNP